MGGEESKRTQALASSFLTRKALVCVPHGFTEDPQGAESQVLPVIICSVEYFTSQIHSILRLCSLGSPKSSSQDLLVGEPTTKMASFMLYKTLISKLQSMMFPPMTQQLRCGFCSLFHSRPIKTVFASSLGRPTGEPGKSERGEREINKLNQLHQDSHHKTNLFLSLSCDFDY